MISKVSQFREKLTKAAKVSSKKEQHWCSSLLKILRNPN